MMSCGRRGEEYLKSRKSEMFLFWSYLSRSILKSPSKTTVFFSEETEIYKIVTIELWKFHGWVSAYIIYYYFFIFRFTFMNVDCNCFDLYISRSFLSLYFKPFLTYIAASPLLHSVAVNSKLYPGITTELRGALFNLNLVLLTPKISNVKLCSEIRAVTFSMWKDSEEIFKWKKDR